MILTSAEQVLAINLVHLVSPKLAKFDISIVFER